MVSTISEVLGGERRPFLILDVDPNQSKATGIGARSAAVRFLNLASKADYFMIDINGALQFEK